MNKSELIAALAEKTEFSKKDAEKALNAFVDTVSARTGAEIKIAASKAPAFKAGKALKDKVNTPAKKKAKK